MTGQWETSDDGAPPYAALGWSRWSGPTAVLAPDGIRATADDALFVRPRTARLNSAMPLVCDWRDGDVW